MKFLKRKAESNILWRMAEEEDKEKVIMFNSAINNSDTKLIKKMIKEDVEMLGIITVFGTFLHVAAKKGNLEAVKVLLKNGADINKNETLHNCRPLASAADKGHLDVVKYLRENGAEYDYSTILSNPLFKSINSGHLHVVKYLVDNGLDVAKVYDTESFGKTNAYTYARSYRQVEICEYLQGVYIKSGYKLDPKEKQPWVNTRLPNFTGTRFTVEKIHLLENELGVKMPEFYRRFLISDFPESLYYKDAADDDNWVWLGKDSSLFHTLRSFIAYNTLDSREKKKEIRDKEYFAIGTNGGGDYYCIRLVDDDNSVYFYQHEADSYTKYHESFKEHIKWLVDEHLNMQ